MPILKCEGHYPISKSYGCGEIKVIKRYGLCSKCYANWLFSDEELAIKERAKFNKKVKKDVKKKQKERANKMKSDCTNWLQKSQTKVQEIVRLIDYGQTCTATDKPIKQAHGGHIHPKGGHPECRLNLHNIHIQSAYSNTYRNDDGKMKEGIDRIYGKEYRTFVENLANKAIVKHSNSFYEQVYKDACKVANELRKDLRKRDKLERLTLRNEINTRLGIYPEDRCLFDSFTKLPF